MNIFGTVVVASLLSLYASRPAERFVSVVVAQSSTVSCLGSTTDDSCLNNPYELCYWCPTSIAGVSTCDTFYGTSCTTSSCDMYQTASSCQMTAVCGWCDSPVTGYAHCLYSRLGHQPMTSCAGGWSTQNPSAPIPIPASGLTLGIMIAIIAAPICFCLCIAGIIIFFICRQKHRAANEALSEGGTNNKKKIKGDRQHAAYQPPPTAAAVGGGGGQGGATIIDLDEELGLVPSQNQTEQAAGNGTDDL